MNTLLILALTVPWVLGLLGVGLWQWKKHLARRAVAAATTEQQLTAQFNTLEENVKNHVENLMVALATSLEQNNEKRHITLIAGLEAHIKDIVKNTSTEDAIRTSMQDILNGAGL